METYQIISLVMTILAGFFGIIWGKARGFIAQLKVLIGTVADAILDNQITREELEAIARELKTLLDIFKKTEAEKVVGKVKNIKRLR